jgi:nucleoid-associated protein YgaU
LIRLVLVYLACIVAIVLLIIQGPSIASRIQEARLQAGLAKPEEAASSPEVAQTPVVAEAAAPAPQEPAPAGAGAAAALAGVVAAVAEPEAPRPKLVVRGGKASLEQTTSAILAELSIVKEQGDTGGEMLEMSSQAITGLKGALGKGSADVVTLEQLVADALIDGKTDAEIDASVNTAAAAGDVSIPAELVTSDGKVDTAVLLASLVTQAQIAAGLAKPVDPSQVIAGGKGVEVHLVTKASGDAEQVQFYTVGAGDSLGAIALKFYGDAAYFPKIYDANRTILSSPDRLIVGQRLAIPTYTAL